LAKEIDADLLIIDEKQGRKIAREQGIKIVGLVGILALAIEKKLIDSNETLRKLENTNFHFAATYKRLLTNS
jgi:predicted nucleic acid-binding protein